MIAAGVIGGLYILCAVVLSVGVREKRGEAGDALRCSALLRTRWLLPGAPLAPLVVPRSWLEPWGIRAGGAEVWVWGLGKALQEPEHPQGTLQHSHEDLALCSAPSEINIIMHSSAWLRFASAN